MPAEPNTQPTTSSSAEPQTFRDRFAELFKELDGLDMALSNAADTYIPSLSKEGGEEAQWQAIEDTWGSLMSVLGDFEYQLGCLRKAVRGECPDV